MQNILSHISDSEHFLKRVQGNGKNLEDTLLVTVNVLEWYASVFHKVGLKTLKEVLNKTTVKKISARGLVKMTEFFLASAP